jgi:hypothetical protein
MRARNPYVPIAIKDTICRTPARLNFA